MARFTINEVGLHELFGDPAGPIGIAMEVFGYSVENRAKFLILDTPKTGRIYTTYFFRAGNPIRVRDLAEAARLGRNPGEFVYFPPGSKLWKYGTRPPHQASAPGEAPASDTGRLVNSLFHSPPFIGDSGLVQADIGAATNYAGYLELGTRYMAPRPFLRPALYSVGERPA